jgi:hypothetical protein
MMLFLKIAQHPRSLKLGYNDPQNLWRKGDPEDIRKVLEASPEYQKAKDELKKKSIGYRLVGKYWPQWEPMVWGTIIAALATLGSHWDMGRSFETFFTTFY